MGQGESALLVKPFVEYLTSSEIHSIMTSGFSTIAGSVLMAYIAMGVDANTLLTACVMSVPGSLLLSKMRIPETEESLTKGKVNIPESKDEESNFLHAATNGSATGVHITLLILGAVLAVVSLYNCIEAIIGTLFKLVDIYDWVNHPINGEPQLVSLKLILSYFFL